MAKSANVCDKWFTDCSGFNIHLRIHADERYKCDLFIIFVLRHTCILKAEKATLL